MKRQRALHWIIGICLATTPMACTSIVPRIDTRFRPFSELEEHELLELEKGRREYIGKCSGCHRLYAPSRGDDAYWQDWVADMSRRSRLGAEEERRIVRYLSVASRIEETPPER